MHLLLTDRGSEPFLLEELRRLFPTAQSQVHPPGLVSSDFVLQPELPPTLVFSRQTLPDATVHQAASIRAWSDVLLAAGDPLPPEQPWQLHIVPHYGSGNAGRHRCELIEAALCEQLQRHARVRLRSLLRQPTPFTETHSFVQLLLTAPDCGYLSVATGPLPFTLRRIVSPFREGEIPVACDKSAPSRAFAKLLEAEQRLGQRVGAGEQCVDLGASPGSWSYVALKRGATVIAVDRTPLRPDLMADPKLVFKKGDAFTLIPPRRVDWMLCDVIAAPQRSIDLLLRWLRAKLTRFFVVTIKFKGTDEYGLLEPLKYALPALCDEFYLTRLTANKNEVCAFGRARG